LRDQEAIRAVGVWAMLGGLCWVGLGCGPCSWPGPKRGPLQLRSALSRWRGRRSLLAGPTLRWSAVEHGTRACSPSCADSLAHSVSLVPTMRAMFVNGRLPPNFLSSIACRRFYVLFFCARLEWRSLALSLPCSTWCCFNECALSVLLFLAGANASVSTQQTRSTKPLC
jgi:hypothetical protein